MNLTTWAAALYLGAVIFSCHGQGVCALITLVAFVICVLAIKEEYDE